MNPTLTTRLLVAASSIVVAVGFVDSAIGGDWDLFTLFLIALVIHGVLLTRTESRRPSIPVRRDLVVWLRRRAAVGSEPLDAVVDRAVATYRDRQGQTIGGEAVRR